MTRKNILLLLLFTCLLLLSFSGSVSAAYQTYSITEPELTRLEQIFSQLSVNNRQLLNDLELSQQDLTTARQKLVSYQTELATLQAQLLTLKAESVKARTELEQANSSLRNAKESLTKYEREVNSEINSLKWQRTGLIVLVGALALK